MKVKIKEIAPHKTLYRDNKNGIAWIHDGSSGNGISIHSNIDASGSVKGMKHLGYWKKDARTIRSHGYIYNIDTFIHSAYSGELFDLENIVADECNCQACIERRLNNESN